MIQIGLVMGRVQGDALSQVMHARASQLLGAASEHLRGRDSESHDVAALVFRLVLSGALRYVSVLFHACQTRAAVDVWAVCCALACA